MSFASKHGCSSSRQGFAIQDRHHSVVLGVSWHIYFEFLTATALVTILNVAHIVITALFLESLDILNPCHGTRNVKPCRLGFLIHIRKIEEL